MEENERAHRTFIAIEFPDNVIKEVARVQNVLGKRRFTGKLTELENAHLTLKFLGEINDLKLEEVMQKLKEVKFEEFEARLEKAGTFNFHGMPRIVWIKVAGKGIFELQKRIDNVLEGIGFKEEERFMSHMTIARIKYVKDKSRFVDYVNKIKLKDIRFRIKEFKLKESELRELGPIYKDLEIYRLG